MTLDVVTITTANIDPFIVPQFTSPTITGSQTSTTYTIGAPVTFDAVTYTISPTCTDANPTYSAFLSNGNALPSFITYDPTNNRFTFDSEDRGDVGSYTISVQVVVKDNTRRKTDFVLTVIDPCLSVSVTAAD
jgi:hypothetical protein